MTSALADLSTHALPDGPRGVVSYVRCRVCSEEMTVIGPTSAPTFEYPGWQVDVASFYTPSGDHYCARHIRRVVIAYCEDADCMALRGSLDDQAVSAPAVMDHADIRHGLEMLGVRCTEGHTLTGIEDVPEGFGTPNWAL